MRMKVPALMWTIFDRGTRFIGVPAFDSSDWRTFPLLQPRGHNTVSRAIDVAKMKGTGRERLAGILEKSGLAFAITGIGVHLPASVASRKLRQQGKAF